MAELVTLELPEQVVRSAREIATRTHRPLEEVLVEWIDRAAAELPVDALGDEQVLALADMQLDAAQNDELSDLLCQNQAGTISEEQRRHLQELMHAYRRGCAKPKPSTLRSSVVCEL